MPYIKSHSNYTLQSQHQSTNDGTIFERDITTISSVDSFSPGQTPIYKSNNFIITVRNDNSTSNQYNASKWKENDVSGNVWTLETVDDSSVKIDSENDTKIVLKQDYYDFRDFAYYGSLTELFRTSVTDIIRRFPGELYASSNHVYYTSSFTEDLETIEDSIILGGDDLYEVSNPFGIDIHSIMDLDSSNVLKFFGNNGYQNYNIINEDSIEPIVNWNVNYWYSELNPDSISSKDKFIRHSMYFSTDDSIDGIRELNRKTSSSPYPCKGDMMAVITLNNNLSSKFVINAYIGDDNIIYYLTKEENIGRHIRPKQEFLDKFYKECDNFEALLINKDTNYKATFSVIRENDYGYYREFIPFKFPKGEGGYNIDATDYGFNAYTGQMVKIGEYYDEKFTDNLWRTMTHEAIKNFDWTYTREYQEGDEEEYVFGGQRIQKALRVFAREFDEILTYINNIKSINRVTYDERSNIPDYFLTDVVENDGWNVKLIYPYTLAEKDEDDNIVEYNDYIEGNDSECSGQINNKTSLGKSFKREFSQDSTRIIKPYSSGFSYGYFSMCGGKVESTASTDVIKFDAEALGGKGAYKNVIRQYHDKKEWSYNKINNEFLRRLKINSPYILRHKGTIEGIEMILGMFGLRSKRMFDNNKDSKANLLTYDYEITEYTSFTNRIEEPWDVEHQNYRINWVNTTKTNYIINGDVTNYQGLPVLYRNEYEYADVSAQPINSYIKKKALADQISGGVESTSSSADSFVKSDGSLVTRRYLYPNFNKYETLDGNPYYQMNGGWLSKIVDDKWNFQYDVDDNIVHSQYVFSGSVGNNQEITDNAPLFKETVRNIIRVDNISQLLSLPYNKIHNGSICYVTNVEINSVVIDGVVYPITNELSGTSIDGKIVSYVSFVKNNGFIKVGNSKFFDSKIIVYNINGEEIPYDIESKSDGYTVKAYFTDDGGFICKEDYDGNYSINSYQILKKEDNMSNYFVIDDINYSDMLADLKTSGWKRLSYTSNECLKINTIINDNKGNNPHNGNMVYDNGHEYFTYFNHIFKYPLENDLFDARCYNDYLSFLYNEADTYRFDNLIHENENIKQYDNFLIEDEKVHFFGNYKKRVGGKNKNKNHIGQICMYGENKDKMCSYIPIYSGECESISNYVERYDGNYSIMRDYTISNFDSCSGITSYILNDDGYMINGTPYPTGNNVDEVTNQIMNNKRLTISFMLHDDWFSNGGQCEIKYIDDIVMNYLTQMIPSTTILQVKYITNTCCKNLNLFIG